jgi:hypothetical protein
MGRPAQTAMLHCDAQNLQVKDTLQQALKYLLLVLPLLQDTAAYSYLSKASLGCVCAQPDDLPCYN